MLEHARTSTGEWQLTDINALADEYLRLAYQGQRAKDKTFGCKLITDFAPDLPKVNVVALEIGRVLLNLHTNAVYATQQRAKQGAAGYQLTLTTRLLESTAVNRPERATSVAWPIGLWHGNRNSGSRQRGGHTRGGEGQNFQPFSPPNPPAGVRD